MSLKRGQCPICKFEVSIQYSEGMESKMVTCPICHQTTPFNTWMRENSTSRRGVLILLRTNFHYELTLLVTVVGRMADSSVADFQIPDVMQSRLMSRSHLKIEKRGKNGTCEFYASLSSQKVNDTFINGQRLSYGQTVLLHPGDIISLPGEQLKFDMVESDEDETEIGYIH